MRAEVKILVTAVSLALATVSCGGADEPATSTTSPTPTIVATSISISTTTGSAQPTSTTTTTSTAPPTTTLALPTPNADPATLIESLATAAEADTFLSVDGFVDVVSPLEVAASDLDCDDPNSRGISTAAALADATPIDSAHIGIQLAFTDMPWRVVVIEFADDRTAIAVVETLDAVASSCPTGSQEIPLENPDGTQATDAAGSPIFITAQLTDRRIEPTVPGDAFAAALITEFVEASGDTAEFRGAFRRGPFLVYVTGPTPAASFNRLMELGDAVLSAAS